MDSDTEELLQPAGGGAGSGGGGWSPLQQQSMELEDRTCVDSSPMDSPMHPPAGPGGPGAGSSSSSASGISAFVGVASAMAAVGGILFGYDIGIISGALLQLQDTWSLGCTQREFVVSSMLIGAVIGSLFGGFIVDHCGRKIAIIVTAAVFVVGALILALANSYPVLISGRVIVGFAVSLGAISECTYISEIAPQKQRGLLVSLNELGITLGFLLAYLVAFLLIQLSDGWRFMFAISVIPAVVQGVAMVFLPASPRFLMLKKKETQARAVLSKLRGGQQCETEINNMKISIASDRGHSMVDLVRSQDNMRGRMFIGIGLVFFQQCTGQPNVLYYAPTIVQSVGFHTKSAATLAAVVLGVVKVVATIISLLCVDKAGRRKFLLVGGSIMMISISTLGILALVGVINVVSNPCDMTSQQTQNDTHHQKRYDRKAFGSESISGHLLNFAHGNELYIHDKWSGSHPSFAEPTKRSTNATGDVSSSSLQSSPARWLALVALMTYIAAYSLGFGPVTWLVLTEIFPASVRGRAISMATIFNWGTNLVISFTFLDLLNNLGVGWTFLLYGGICLLSVGFVFFCVPETKGRSLEQINADLNKSSAAKRLVHNCQKCTWWRLGVQVNSPRDYTALRQGDSSYSPPLL